VRCTVRDGRFRRVSFVHELHAPRELPYRRRGRSWELVFDQPDVDRLEYLLEVEWRDGRVERLPDPGNPLRAPGAFGDKSVLELPGYAPPAWVDDEESARGDVRELELGSAVMRTTVQASLWSAAELDPAAPAPLLLVHDGPEFARFSSLLRLFDHVVAFGDAPPFRAALLPPPLDRNETYSASARYARALARDWLPALAEAAPHPRLPVALGASLGALAFLHAHWTQPGLLGGLFLQSGSYFRRRLDSHESDFGRFERVVRFVGTVVGGRSRAEPVPVTLACGTAEENIGNNRVVAVALAAQGWDVRFVEHRDAHNWISWRDVLHPHLAELLVRAAG
jgi:enterochelin esterase-like enzyme